MRIALAISSLFVGSSLFAAKISTNQAASVVLGQSSFVTSIAEAGANRMSAPRGVAVDPAGKVYVADTLNNRVLRFSSLDAVTSGANAEAVLGQTGFGLNGTSGASATSMFRPSAVAVDAVGRLYVADTGYNRVLRFDSPSTAANGAAASGVLGQANFTTSTSTIAAAGMNAPTGLTVGSGYLWVADTNNNRVTGFASPANLANGAAATKVFGQANLTTKDAPNPPSAASMNAPEGVVIGADGVLWVSDTFNNRALRFPAASGSANGASADAVLGQPNFTSNTVPSNPSATNLYRPEHLAVDASGATTSLWVVDRVHNRVLRFDDSNNLELADGAAAVVVLGQASLSADASGTTVRTFAFPFGVVVDDSDTASSPRPVWVADQNNNRVLRFNPQEPPPPASPTIAGKASYKTKKPKQKVSGTVSAPAGLSVMRYKAAKGGLKSVSVSGSKWSFTASCKVGTNRFTVYATDKLNRTVSKQFVVKRAKK